ncbi:hypothetical protein [Dokdonia sp.]|uniref:hypothetical protein n=1 Tax=Dokdonia sp. TaxID=2024995 RepID=UPI003265945E
MKKKINIALIVVMVIVYGGIAYKYFGGGTSNEQTDTATYTGEQLRLPENRAEKENVFALNLSNRDPFLDKKYTAKKRASSIIGETTPRIKTNKKPMSIHWPTITYLGFTKSNSQTRKTAVLRIDGKLYRKREGSTIDHIKVLKIVGDSIYIMFNKKEKQYFYKNKEQ